MRELLGNNDELSGMVEKGYGLAALRDLFGQVGLGVYQGILGGAPEPEKPSLDSIKEAGAILVYPSETEITRRKDGTYWMRIESGECDASTLGELEAILAKWFLNKWPKDEV